MIHVVNDRGTMKWTTMMLPEHVKLLKEMWSQRMERKAYARRAVGNRNKSKATAGCILQ